MEKGFTKKIKKVVIKIGTSVLTAAHNRLDKDRLKSISQQISKLKKTGINVVLVSSGAIASGMQLLNLTARPKNLSELQAAAAIGQSQLMHDYEKLFRRYNFITAQVLLTAGDLQDRERYLNARNTLLNLLEKNVIPIVNENDTVATEEIKFGDNDRLSALVASLIDADLLIILSDVDGLYSAEQKIIDTIHEIDPLIKKLAKDTAKQTSVGGMITKLEAARIATNAGIPMIIANGNKADVLIKISGNEQIGTRFLPKQNRLLGKKRWIAFSCKSCGKIIIDGGAKQAILEKGRSLLSGGILRLEGVFQAGDLVLICDEKNSEIARGLTNYSAVELEKIKGLKTSMIEGVLGYKFYDEVVHRNNLAILR